MSKNAKKWLYELSEGLTSPSKLVEESIATPQEVPLLKEISDIFDIRIPTVFLDAIKNGNEALSKQFVPSAQELVFLPEELTDPIGDEDFSPVEGLTHRYPNRVLLKPTYLCASYCRYCFRRYKVSDGTNNLSQKNFFACLEYIKSHPEIWEVILTGGDPFVLNDKYLLNLLTHLSAIEHLKVIRFHSRVPSVLPSRINLELVHILKSIQKTIWIVVHMNTVEEFTAECRTALKLLIDNGFPILMQSVLLKGINDSFDKLRQLFETAVANRVKPYYLHYPDLAKGTQHFRMSLEEAQNLFAQLRGNISGLCLPTFVLDIPGGLGKISAEKSRIWKNNDGLWILDSILKKSIKS